MQKNLLFIGAGASYGARDGIQDNPPLAPNLLPFLKNKLEEYQQAKNHCLCMTRLGKTNYSQLEDIYRSKLPYEKAIEEILKQHNNRSLLLNCNHFLTHIFSGCHASEFTERKDRYDNLIAKLGIDSNWIVISLNYDVLFEQALDRAKIQFRYVGLDLGPHSNESDKNVSIFKPHGSINWFGTNTRAGPTLHLVRQSASRISIDSQSNAITTESAAIYSVNLKSKTIIDALSGHIPLMAHYSDSKVTHNNFFRLKKIRSLGIDSTKEIDVSYIIGVRLPDEQEDVFVSQLFEKLKRKRMLYINPSQKDCCRFNKKFSKSIISKQTLEEWVLAKS